MHVGPSHKRTAPQSCTASKHERQPTHGALRDAENRVRSAHRSRCHLSQKIDCRCIQCGSSEITRLTLRVLCQTKSGASRKAPLQTISYEQCENRASACTKRPRPPKSLAPAYSTALATAAATTLDRTRVKRLGHDEVFAKFLVGHGAASAERRRQQLHFFGNARRARGLEAPFENARKRNHVVNLVRESERPVPTTRAPAAGSKISGVGLAIANRIASPFID